MNQSTGANEAEALHCPFCDSPISIQPCDDEAVSCDHCGGSFRPSAPVAETTVAHVKTLGRFQVLDCVGRGSFGAVWRARDTALERLVALKIPHANLLDDDRFRERFRAEARMVARLRHPGIVPVHEVLEVDGQPILVTDYIDGVSLTELMVLQRLTFRESATLVADVADALDHAHDHGLVHRDIKPANILIENAPQPKPADSVGKALVVDFGVALREEAQVVMTVDGQLIGTPSHMSPEQADGRGHQADRRSDVYSLGVVLYQLLCGELPFRGTRAMVLHQVVHEAPRPPRRLNDRIPRDLETICLKALAKEPGWRYATAGELAADLRRYLLGEPVLARPLGRAVRLLLWSRRNQALAFAYAVALAALLGVLGLSVAIALKERRHSTQLAAALDKSNTHLHEAQYRLAESYVTRGLALNEENNVAEGQLLLARALAVAPMDAVELRDYLRVALSAWQSRHCTLQAYFDHPKSLKRAFLSTDGKTLLAVGFDQVCFAFDAADGAPRAPLFQGKKTVLAALGTAIAVSGHDDGSVRRWALPAFTPIDPPLETGGGIAELAVSRDGSLIFVRDENGKVMRWRGRDGFAAKADLFIEGEALCVAVSPDGTRAFTGGVGNRSRLWDAASGAVLRTLSCDESIVHATFSADGAVLATAGNDGRVRLWETANAKAREFSATHPRAVRSIALSPDGRYVLTGCSDRKARVWSVATQQMIASPLIHAGAVEAVAFSTDSALVVTCSKQSTNVWSLPGRIELENPDKGWFRCMAFSPDGRMLLTGSGEVGKNGSGRLSDGFSGKSIATPLHHKDIVVSAAFSPDHRFIATAGLDDKVRLANPHTGRPVATLDVGADVIKVAFSPAGDLVLTASEGRLAQLWNPETGHAVGAPLSHEGAVRTIGFSPRGDSFFSGDDTGSFCLWRTLDQAPRFPPVKTGPIRAAAFSRDGLHIAVAAGSSVQLFDTSTGAFTATAFQHRGNLRSVAFSPDDRLIVAAGDDGMARLWAMPGVEHPSLSLAHSLPAVDAIFSPDGRLVLTGSQDGTARLWDSATGRQVGPSMIHRGVVTSIAFSPDGSRFATGSSGRTGWLWKTPAPWEGEPYEIVRRAEVLTGLRLDENDHPMLLESAEWRDLALRFNLAGVRP